LLNVNSTRTWISRALALLCLCLPAALASAQPPTQQTAPEPRPSPQQTEPEPPQDTIFTHSETARWWISGQANTIFQVHPGFHALYSGQNSLRPGFENAVSDVVTLYTGYELNQSTEVLFDLESAGGGGLSDALGLAGFTNLDVVRNPQLGAKPYIARIILHKVIPLGEFAKNPQRNPVTSILRQLPTRRLEFRIGKFGTADYFDLNSVGSDSHLQFMNWVADNNGSYDYAADTRGYTFGGIAEYQDKGWALRFGEMLMPKVANGPDLDFNLRRARAENIELELRPVLHKDRATVLRFLSYVNHANMGSYREAIRAFQSGIDPVPSIEAHRRQGRIKYGFGFNFEHELTETTRVFGRTGWNEGQNESFAYTEVNQSVQLGADWKLKRFHRHSDKAGAAFMSDGISRVHQLYLALGGNGFLLGDGRLNYGRENIVEAYYTARIGRGVSVGPDLQYIVHPGYNRDRGPVVVPGLRLHLEL
jgi:high affinity Mn2+ porin